jgi:hypothetical protein
MRKIASVGLFIIFALSASAQETPIHQLYRNILTQPGGGFPKGDEIFAQVNEVTVRALSQTEVDAILPLVFQCVHSPTEEVRGAGSAFLISVMLRFDSAKLLESYIDDLGKLADEKDNARRRLAVVILGGLIPRPPDKAIAYLEANLENSRNSSQETQSIAASLLHASKLMDSSNLSHWAPADPSIVHKVLAFVAAHPDTDLTSNVLHEIGLEAIQVPEAIDFVSANLDGVDPRLRAAAVEGASRLDKDTRAQFSSQLKRIASDPKEDKNVRNQAAQALKP